MTAGDPDSRSRRAIEAWQAQGSVHLVAGRRVFVVDTGPHAAERAEPLLVVHGFPTSSYDFAHLLPALAEHRRVVLVDLLGYGLSEKPDLSYTMALQADLLVALSAELGLEEMALLTHDMGDTVGGELLARHSEGTWPVEVTRRAITNGSIYIDMARLTDGQHMLLALPDAALDAELAPTAEDIAAALSATLAPAHRGIDMSVHAELVACHGGNRMLARTIRYVEERRANERRFTGAIEAHPSPLAVLWGPEDPIAVAAMAERLCAARPDAELSWVEGAGHYPQIEAPEAFLAALQRAVGP
jgi:pimeloyl-ACP methyl ester carboxylesterase